MHEEIVRKPPRIKDKIHDNAQPMDGFMNPNYTNISLVFYVNILHLDHLTKIAEQHCHEDNAVRP